MEKENDTGSRSTVRKPEMMPIAPQAVKPIEFASGLGVSTSAAGIIIVSFYGVDPDTKKAYVNYRAAITAQQASSLVKSLTRALEHIEKKVKRREE